ncbi:glutathione binding-like protein [Halomonas sp. WWR20]
MRKFVASPNPVCCAIASMARLVSSVTLVPWLASQRIIGLALAACEKTVQIVYEFNLRPAEKRYQPWVERIHTQLTAAYELLEAEFTNRVDWRFGTQLSQADITTAIAWQFTQNMIPQFVSADEHPALVTHSQKAEALPAFLAMPPS